MKTNLSTARQGRMSPHKESFLHRAVRELLIRTPLLVPLLVVVGVIIGGVWGWGLVATAGAVACVLRMPRILLCASLLGAIVWLSNSVRQQKTEEVLSRNPVLMQAEVVGSFGSSWIVESSWLGVRALLSDKSHEWQPGDQLQLVARKYELPEPPVPGMFSSSSWMRGQGIAARLNCIHADKLPSTGLHGRLVLLSEEIRSALADKLMPPGTESDPRCQVLCALTLGEKGRADPATMEVFRRGGCLHVFAVSGLHVGIVAGILWLLLRLCRVHPAAGRYIVLIAVGAYVFATGMAAPAVRAYVMLLVLTGGLILRRRVGLFNAWCMAALLILTVQPWQFYQAGFQLSFVVYGAICLGIRYGLRGKPWFGPDDYVPSRIHTPTERGMVRTDIAIRGAVLVSVSAWLVSLPLVMYQFHVVNTASYLINIALTPVVPVVMLLGLLAVVLSWAPFLGVFLHTLAMKSAGILLAMVGLSGSVPGFYLPAARPQPPSSLMVVCLQHNKSFAVLGNPGMLVGDVDNETSARYSVVPAVFHSGFSPSIACGLRRQEVVSFYKREWSRLLCIDPFEVKEPFRISTPAGTYTVFPPPRGIPKRPAANAQPVIVWQRPDGMRYMYVGNAAMSTLESIPPDECRADVLILGYNSYAPVADGSLIADMKVQRLILLPSAAELNADGLQLPPGITRLRLSEGINPFLLESPDKPEPRPSSETNSHTQEQ